MIYRETWWIEPAADGVVVTHLELDMDPIWQRSKDAAFEFIDNMEADPFGYWIDDANNTIHNAGNNQQQTTSCSLESKVGIAGHG